MKLILATRISPRTRALVLGVGGVLTLVAVGWVDGGAAGGGAAAVEAVVPAARGGGGAAARGGAGGGAADRMTPGAASMSAPAPGRAGQQARTIATDRLDRTRALADPGGDPFALAAWSRSRSAAVPAPAPAMAPPPPPPPPMAPPLPFTFFGRMVDGAVQQVFLNHDTRALIVAAGETIDNLYRVERIEEQAVHFTYLPLGQPQVLAIPGTP